MKHALFAAALLLATPAFAQTPGGDAEALAQTPVYQSIPAHQDVADTNAIGADGEILAAIQPKSAPAHQAVADNARIPSGDAEALQALTTGNSSVQ